MSEQELREKVTALTAERDTLVQEVNQRLAFLNGQISAYEAMLTATAGDAIVGVNDGD